METEDESELNKPNFSCIGLHLIHSENPMSNSLYEQNLVHVAQMRAYSLFVQHIRYHEKLLDSYADSFSHLFCIQQFRIALMLSHNEH